VDYTIKSHDQVGEYFVGAAKRKLDESDVELDNGKGRKIHKSLRDNPRPINTPALRKRKERELETEEVIPHKKQLQTSIIMQPNINKEKKIEKAIRDKERFLKSSTNSKEFETASSSQSNVNLITNKEEITSKVDNVEAPREINQTRERKKDKNNNNNTSNPNNSNNGTIRKTPVVNDINNNNTININNNETIIDNNHVTNNKNILNKLINTDGINNNNNNDNNNSMKIPRVNRIIKMLSNYKEYDVWDDLSNTKCNITFGQLWNAAPKIRSQVSQGLKLVKATTNVVGAINNVVATTTLVNNVDHNYKSKSTEITEEDIAMVDASVDGVSGKLLIDTCSNLNIMSQKYYNSLPYQYTVVGHSCGRIMLATRDDEYSEGIVVRIPVKINELSLLIDFRIVEKEEPFYDMLINLKTIVDNRLFINPLNNCLCKYNMDGTISSITPINNSAIDEKYICSVNKLLEDNSKEKYAGGELKKLEGLPPMEYIHNTIFMNTLNEKYRTDIIHLLEDNIEIVATSSEELTPSLLSPHKINLKAGTKPIKQRAYRLTKLKTDILKEELTKLINKKLIEPSNSEWSSPIVLVPKPNGKWRMCVDYRKVNDSTIKDSYSIPYIDEIFDSLNGATIFTTIDLYSGYHQILMEEESIGITTFTTKFGNYQFKVMPFGLTNAPATFQREMNRILFPLIGKCVYNFIDDILIYSKTVEEHLQHIQQVLSILKENRLKLNIEKCHFMKTEVNVLGHRLTTKGLKPLDSKIEVIRDWKPPQDIHELRSFLGAVGYYRNFIDKYSQITACLCKLLRKGVKYVWTSEHQKSFEVLKEKLINAPILSFPQFDKEFIIRTDASYDGIGGVLLQKDNETGKEHPIHFISRSLTRAEKHYGITDLEGAALYYCITKLKPYIDGNPIPTIVYTDHKPLLGLFKNKEPHNARQTRWCLTASMLGVDIRYETGKKNVLADALSRMKNNKENVVLATKIINHDITNDENEALLSKVIHDFINEKFTTIDGIDYFIDGNNYRKLVTDLNERIKLILEAHNIGHDGYYKTYQRLRKSYYWNDMVNDVKRVVSKCEKCQLNRPQPYPEPTENLPTKVEGPFVHLGLDIIGPLVKTRSNNQYIIVAVDYFTKWVEAEPTENITSKDVIKFLINVFSRHGVPQVITTDNGAQFTSDMTKIFLDLYDVYIKFVTTYHPESNGLTENRNKEIGKLLRLLGTKNKDWDEVLPSALWALRTVKNSTTNHSSFELVYGREDQQPFDIAARPTKGINKSSDEILLEKFISHYRWTIEASENVKNANKYWAVRREEKQSMNQAKEIKEGDLVLVRNFSRTKLEPYFNGPLKVIKKKFNTVTLADPNSGILLNRNVHLKNIVKYNSATI